MRLVVGVSGASGVIVAIRLLQALQEMPAVETHLVITKDAEKTIAYETDWTPKAVKALAEVAYAPDDVAAPIASGSYATNGMAIVPCSMKSLAGLAGGYADNLLLRAADVTLKERRRLVVVPRESPLRSIHLRNMLALAEEGALVMMPAPAFYARPQTLADVVDQLAGRILDAFELDNPLAARWTGAPRHQNGGRGASGRSGTGPDPG